jgi:hypothetical protein
MSRRDGENSVGGFREDEASKQVDLFASKLHRAGGWYLGVFGHLELLASFGDLSETRNLASSAAAGVRVDAFAESQLEPDGLC